MSPGSFDLIFLNQPVIITIKQTKSIVMDSEHGLVTETSPIEYEGFLLEIDDENYYLGNQDGEIIMAVSKSERVSVKLSDGMEVINKVLTDLSPERDEDIN